MSTNLEHDDLESCHSQKTCSTATSPLGPLQTSYLTFPSQSYPSPPSRTVLKGYKFYKADPSLDEAATWACAERTELRMKQEQLYEMIHERAEDYSARQQYKNLSRDQRAQVTQLAEDQRVDYPRMEWSCVYAKESYYANKARNPNRHDFETVSMTIIMTGRPMEPTKYPRTPMGEPVWVLQSPSTAFCPKASETVPEPGIGFKTGGAPISALDSTRLMSAPGI
ncbi:hypothetical protein N7499_003685 [Penicillium canescens]|nr:hypothetical protein N7522_001837 [Penicillium canescens]KAJ6066353.1 hypothetical protein N7444_000106 [Penicillium canescens]KAJ6090971.1 hypothetical protein N7499_003685 [Penicillium canescens]KAJ6175194.1 hypothetical protein N7485_004999 [Penicillium canescens]